MVKVVEKENSNKNVHMSTQDCYIGPFQVIHNHRRILRAKALKKLKKEERAFELKLQKQQKVAQKEEFLRSWNHSMLLQDSVWENAYDTVRKQIKQEDSTDTGVSPYMNKLQNLRIHLAYSFAKREGQGIFPNKFQNFEWNGLKNANA